MTNQNATQSNVVLLEPDQVRGPMGEFVADCHCHSKRQEKDRANAARIIACWNGCLGINPEAVPMMLEALRGLIEFADNGTPIHPGALVLEDARAALAKAQS